MAELLYADADVELAAETLDDHHPTRGMAVTMGVTCECQYWTGAEPLNEPRGHRPLPWGRDRLDIHRARLVLDALTAAGWRPHAIESTIEQANQTRANTRAVVAEEIARALEARRPHIPPPMATDRRQRLVQRSTLNEAARVAREIGGRDASA
jgi:hypothetical protein